MTIKNILLLLIFFIGCLTLYCCDKDSPDEILRRRMLIEVNRIRMSGCACGNDSLPPIHLLQWSDELTLAAKRHTTDMSTNNFLSHTGSDNSTPLIRAQEAGFEGIYFGENIARGYSNVDDVIKQWINSEYHCKNIMNYRYTHMGVATEDFYWTLVFGGGVIESLK